MERRRLLKEVVSRLPESFTVRELQLFARRGRIGGRTGIGAAVIFALQRMKTPNQTPDRMAMSVGASRFQLDRPSRAPGHQSALRWAA
jgi:hypothetical protein